MNELNELLKKRIRQEITNDSVINHLIELVDKDTNGIYISKDEAQELLEALELLDTQEIYLYQDMRAGAILRYELSKSYPEIYSKLRNALGGKQ